MDKLTRIEIHAVDHCTQRCGYCSHAADVATRAIYTADQYVPWLRKLAQITDLQTITVLGGEPFLHPNLSGFLTRIRPLAPQLHTMTNLYWLRSRTDIDARADIFRQLDLVVVTYYRPYCERVGGIEAMRDLIGYLRRSHPHLQVTTFNDAIADSFAVLRFHPDPRPVQHADCLFGQCLQLLHDGTLLRCCVARRVLAGTEPLRADQVQRMTSRIDGATRESLSAWLNSPRDLCRYCSLATDGVTFEPWQSRATQ